MKRLVLFPSVIVALFVAIVVAAPASAVETEPNGRWPLHPRPEVVGTFDPPAVAWGSGHRGVDLRGSVGQPVRSALPGRVSFAGRIAGVGIVVVDHGATRTTYQPVDATVRVGAEVTAGTVIGALEWFGTHCLPAACLHWGLLRGDVYLDPLSLVDTPSPVRLLPLRSGTGSSASPSPLRPAFAELVQAPGGHPVPAYALVP